MPVVLDEQIQPGSFEFVLRHLVDEELDLSSLDAKFRNDATGASAYVTCPPRMATSPAAPAASGWCRRWRGRTRLTCHARCALSG